MRRSGKRIAQHVYLCCSRDGLGGVAFILQGHVQSALAMSRRLLCAVEVGTIIFARHQSCCLHGRHGGKMSRSDKSSTVIDSNERHAQRLEVIAQASDGTVGAMR